MTLKEQVLHSVTKHLGASVAVEEESGLIVYADCLFEKIYHKNPQGQLAEDLFPWLGDCPEIEEYDKVTEWETFDITNHRFFRLKLLDSALINDISYII